MPVKFHVERMMHRSSIAVAGESAASYALIKLIPNDDGSTDSLPLNIALVLDVSGSMYEEDGLGISRLQRVQEAAVGAIAKLKPEDTLSVVAFAHEAQVILPPTRLADLAAIEDAIRRIDSFGVDPGGTAMDQGIALGIEEVSKNTGTRQINQVVVLTDGETTQDEACRTLAQQARDQNIRLTLLGVGTEWNANLIKDMARRNEGRWYYIDSSQVQEPGRVFQREFERLSATAIANGEIHIRPTKEVRVKRLRQVVPEITNLPLEERENRHVAAHLGALEKDRARRYILEMSLPRRPDGKYVIAQMEITYDLGVGQRDTSGPMPLEMQYTSAGPGYVNAEVAKHIDEVQIFELNNNLQKALTADDASEAQRLAENIAKKGDIMGPRGALKTMLARQVLEELHHVGRVSKKTQLAVDDAARLAEVE
jgi:Ca-activated chloride channel family protein